MSESGIRLSEAVRSLEGLPVGEWRNGYGDSGSLHLGRYLKENPPRHERATRSCGEVIVSVWGATAAFTRAGATGEIARHPPLELRALGLENLAGVTIVQARWSDTTGALSLRFSSDAELDLVLDEDAHLGADQWVLETTGKGTYIVRPGPSVTEER